MVSRSSPPTQLGPIAVLTSVLIQYETLVSEEDASKPKKEDIDVSLIRPAPPEDNADEVHDVVDAEKEEKYEQKQVGQLDGEAICHVKKRSRPYSGEQKSQVYSPSPSVRNARKARSSELRVQKSSAINNEQIPEASRIESSGFGSEHEVMGGSHAGSSFLLAMEVLKKSVRNGVAVASVKNQLAVSGIPAKEPDHDQSLVVKKGDSTITIEGSMGGRETQIGVKGNEDTEDSPNLPFVKSIPLWADIESMKVFKRFPQKPHFHPLLNTKEVFREGSAIGKMLAFASLVEQTTKLRVDDPRDIIDSYLEDTVELELHGFDVRAIKHCLSELLDLKVKREEFHKQSKIAETKILEWSQNRSKYTETISGIDKEVEDLKAKIKDIKEKRAMQLSICSANYIEESKLRLEVEVINEEMRRIRHDFETLARAPL